MKLKSNCCNDDVILREKDFYSGGIRFEHRCSKCQKICDVYEDGELTENQAKLLSEKNEKSNR